MPSEIQRESGVGRDKGGTGMRQRGKSDRGMGGGKREGTLEGGKGKKEGVAS